MCAKSLFCLASMIRQMNITSCIPLITDYLVSYEQRHNTSNDKIILFDKPDVSENKHI